MKRENFGERPPRPGARRVAVVGSGISGLASAWLLSRHHEVSLFESEARLGGHTNTVPVSLDGHRFQVDTGFLVFNRKTYPNLCALFAHLGVDAVEAEMNFSVSLRDPEIEWAGSSLATLFAQHGNLMRPPFWRMLVDIVRFNRVAGAMVEPLPTCALGEYLRTEGYSDAFRDWYLLPMAAAIWSCPTRRMLDYPLSSFLRFCGNHGLLQVFGRPTWLTVKGGGREYVRKMSCALRDLRLSTPVLGLLREGDSVWVFSARGAERFDEVVLACHSDQALRILGDGAHREERNALGAVPYQPNTAWLHTDERLLPRRRAIWSAWNYLAGSPGVREAPVSVSYLINRLQPLPVKTPVVVTLNPHEPPREERVLARFEYAHPVFDLAAGDAQAAIGRLQGRGHVWYAGAWTGYGFHEDGLKSALAVAAGLGVEAAWSRELARAEGG